MSSSNPESRHSWKQSISSLIFINDQTHSRTASTISEQHPQPGPEPEQDDSEPEDQEHEPTAFDSTTALILEPDDPSLFLSFEEDEDGAESLISSPLNVAASLPTGLSPLPTFILQSFLISPSLLLGATLLQASVNAPGSGFSRVYAIILWAVVAGFLASLGSQIWVFSGTYVRKWSMEEVVSHALLGASNRRHDLRDKWRRRVIFTSRTLLALLGVLICFIYLHEACGLILQNVVEPSILVHAGVVLVFALSLSYFLVPTSMGSWRIWIATGVTILAHVIDGIIMLVRHGQSIGDHPTSRSPVGGRSLPLSVNWEGYQMLAFTFASPLLTYPLYVSRLVPSPNVSATAPKPRRIPWPIHTIAAALLSAALLTPYLLVPISSAQPNPILRSVALASGIPPIWILAVVPRLPNPSSTSPYYARGTYKYALWTFLTLIAVLIPTESSFIRGLRRIIILAVIFTTYLLPALLHIALHLLRAPLAILIGASSTLPGESADPEHQRLEVDPQLPNSGNAPLPSDAEALLRRKERSLQRRRFGRRIAWDALVLVVLLPVGGWLTIWSFGSVFGIW